VQHFGEDVNKTLNAYQVAVFVIALDPLASVRYFHTVWQLARLAKIYHPHVRFLAIMNEQK
jgi:hypothetical protein